jgi:hypothetical protein
MTGALSNATMAIRRPVTNDVPVASNISAAWADFRVIVGQDITLYASEWRDQIHQSAFAECLGRPSL